MLVVGSKKGGTKKRREFIREGGGILGEESGAGWSVGREEKGRAAEI